MLAARRTQLLAPIVEEIRARGGSAQLMALDVVDPASVTAAVTSSGRIDVLINNAGVANTKAVLEQTEADWDLIVGTNLKGAWLVATEVARSMRANQVAGSIINIASILGLRQGQQLTPYAVSKAGMIQLTKQLALELARYRIRVNAIAPGYFATPLNQVFFEGDAGKALIGRIPQRRLGNLADLDGPLLLLASNASEFMTGAVITVDGGHLLSQL
jgi:NAD(P)-dependent dehydrogenase (short-subunit alcohol dehydrogenase family)